MAFILFYIGFYSILVVLLLIQVFVVVVAAAACMDLLFVVACSYKLLLRCY